MGRLLCHKRSPAPPSLPSAFQQKIDKPMFTFHANPPNHGDNVPLSPAVSKGDRSNESRAQCLVVGLLINRSLFRIEPTAVAYKAAFKREVPLDELPFRVNFRGKPYKPATLEESLEYVKSAGLFIVFLHAVEFTKLYRGKPVWFYHRRNFKGHFPPKRPRKSCTHGDRLITSNPCPICRDEYLVLDYQNVYLLKHFLHPQSAEILEPTITGLCEKQHHALLLEIEKARDLGRSTFPSSVNTS
ncbi:unnamed protein product [Dibothriocephalus latus]|uniref:Small ribosomal subunit protein mS40 n=1 Tax=Dibothriocephalus latus TaxID=60516 RepID=A0A3P7LS76_DIBLA|nr:unnamed protein product [Dibothriocephalus latus]